MTTTRRQHYVPQFYLRGFAHDGRLWMVRRDNSGNVSSLFSSSPKDLCVERDLYEVGEATRYGGIYQRNSIENHFSELEDKLSAMLTEVCEFAKSPRSLSDDESFELICFPTIALMASMTTRSPREMRRHRAEARRFATRSMVGGMVADWELRACERYGANPFAVVEHTVLWSELFGIDPSLATSALVRLYSRASLCLFRAGESEFVTSSAPCVAIGDGAGNSPVACMSLSRDVAALVISEDEPLLTVKTLGADGVMEFNQAMLSDGEWTQAISGSAEVLVSALGTNARC